MTDSVTTDLDHVLSRLDDLHADLSDTQQAMLTAILAKAAGPADDEVAGFALVDEMMGVRAGALKPSSFRPHLKGFTNGWGQDVI